MVLIAPSGRDYSKSLRVLFNSQSQSFDVPLAFAEFSQSGVSNFYISLISTVDSTGTLKQPARVLDALFSAKEKISELLEAEGSLPVNEIIFYGWYGVRVESSFELRLPSVMDSRSGEVKLAEEDGHIDTIVTAHRLLRTSPAIRAELCKALNGDPVEDDNWFDYYTLSTETAQALKEHRLIAGIKNDLGAFIPEIVSVLRSLLLYPDPLGGSGELLDSTEEECLIDLKLV